MLTKIAQICKTAFEKNAGSELYLRPGRMPTYENDEDLLDDWEQNIYSPSGPYHYMAQGKYTGVPLLLPKKINKLTEELSGGFNYVPPENTDAYIKAYDTVFSQRLADSISQQMERLNALEENASVLSGKERDNFIRKHLSGGPASIEEARKIYRNVMTEHKKVVDYMRRHAKQGFTIGVPW